MSELVRGRGSWGSSAFFGDGGDHQKIGYLDWTLLVSNVTTTITVEDSRTTGRKYQDRLLMARSTTGRRAVAPAGGWVVFVICMATMAVAVARDAASQASRGG